MFKSIKWAKVLTFISGGGLAGVFAYRSKDPASWGMALIALAGLAGTLFPSPAQAVVRDAQVTTPGGTPTGATVVSSSSDLLPTKP